MESKIATAVSQIPLSGIREMWQRAAEYESYISLGIGEPDFNTPEQISNQALQDALQGATHYTQSQGDPELLEAIKAYLHERLGEGFSTGQIVVTTGGVGGLTSFFRTVLNPGEEVLIPEPYFPPYRHHIEWVGGKAVPVQTRFENGFVPTPEDLEAAITPNTKALLLNSPNNPTGAVIPGEILDNIARVVLEHDLLVLSDEVYERLLFDGLTHDSIRTRPGMKERTVVVHSFSKSFAMTGWRIGYAFGPEWLIGSMIKVVSSTTSCAPSVSQRAGLAALQLHADVIDAMVEEFRVRRNQTYEALEELPGVKVHKPRGTFYIFPDISQITHDSRQFALDLLKEEQVVVIPGEAFGPAGKGCLRIAFTVKQEILKEALERIQRFIKKIS
ncbi:MAG: pyridoxal phosphate-dependent aminotransferase [Deltaproteobacteria bacterium]|nr:pyridoxal phosphate-dependent aminotransferase [Deltaproteobacteria bacterium]